jgi:DNA-binding transcriptional regulator YhcF (GntR family)
MHYLKSLLALKTSSGTTNPCVLLPSLESLGEAFQLSAWEVRKALRELKAEGYDNFIPGLYGHITIWDKKTAVAV